MSQEQAAAYDPSNEEHVKGRDRRIKDRAKVKALGLAQIMASVTGRMWMWDLLTQCDLIEPVIPIAGGSDGAAMALNTHFRLGKYSIGVMLRNEINRLKNGPELYAVMARENQA